MPDGQPGASEGKPGLPTSLPVNPGQGIPPGHLKLEAGRPKRAARVDQAKAQFLAAALAGLLAESSRTQHALWQREAELAAGVPLVSAPDEATQLAQRLEAVLRGGARAIGCHAAALYLLDEATSRLKLRSCWGLPRSRLADEARPLRGSVADLEALLGNAVVLDDPLMMKHWKVPEEFPAAVCVPVGTSTTILGTLWIFSTRQRTFNDRQTNIVEVIAGRLAADLEREMLLREGVEGSDFSASLGRPNVFSADQLPNVAPPIDGWDLAGWVAPAQQLTGNFFDWFTRPDATVGLTLGEAAGTPAEAALSAGGLKMALRCHGRHESRPHEILSLVNGTIWTASAGGQIRLGLRGPASPRRPPKSPQRGRPGGPGVLARVHLRSAHPSGPGHRPVARHLVPPTRSDAPARPVAAGGLHRPPLGPRPAGPALRRDGPGPGGSPPHRAISAAASHGRSRRLRRPPHRPPPRRRHAADRQKDVGFWMSDVGIGNSGFPAAGPPAYQSDIQNPTSHIHHPPALSLDGGSRCRKLR